MKPILLIIDGMDRTGKTSVIKEINKQTNYAPLIIDRGPIGYKAYSELFNKDNKPEDYDMLETSLLHVNHLCVYLFADENIIYNRCIDTNEPLIYKGIRENLRLYKKYYDKSILNKIILDSGKYTTKEIVKIILNEVEKNGNKNKCNF